jgi:hypothetical protein
MFRQDQIETDPKPITILAIIPVLREGIGKFEIDNREVREVNNMTLYPTLTVNSTYIHTHTPFVLSLVSIKGQFYGIAQHYNQLQTT